MDVIYLDNINRDTYISKAKQSVFAIGFFDGIHKGHQKVLGEAKKIADKEQLPLVCMSFYPHPKEVLTNKKEKVHYLMPMEKKKSILKKIGVDTFYIIQFDPQFASLFPEQFADKYLLDLGAKYLVAGFDFTYGYRGKGNMDRIETDSRNMLQAIKVDKVEYKGNKISSTIIRELISLGEFDTLHNYLGCNYQSEGKILLNNKTPEIIMNTHYLFPTTGRYDVEISNAKNKWFEQVSVEEGKIKIEASISDFDSIRNFTLIEINWLKRQDIKLVSQLV